jgi:acyl-CoA synthetase (NDP forming)
MPVTLSQTERLFRPKRDARTGASSQRGTIRHTVVRVLKHVFLGSVYPVSSTRQEIEGLWGYRSLAALPETPPMSC